ncbi:MAG TPA: DUF4878 domain-containing protein [Hanamia sp.]|nr:DUF4878 domain-containing protein [Hanamia sp.]
MKKIIVIIVTAFAFFISGCKSGANGENPKEVLNHFFSDISKKDFTDAKKYSTQDSEGMISMMEMGMQQMNNDHADKMMQMVNNMQMGDATISGDSATVPVTDKKSGESTDFLLKKENGNWKVAFDMSTLMNMANKKMMEHGLKGMHRNDSSDMNTDTINNAEKTDTAKGK